MKLFRPRHLFRIEKARPGEYANSPFVWTVCGYIRARDRAAAEIEAAFKVGSSLVRVIPEEPC
jgi:hypothetical protein